MRSDAVCSTGLSQLILLDVRGAAVQLEGSTPSWAALPPHIVIDIDVPSATT